MIVKIQRPLDPPPPDGLAYIYNKSRRFTTLLPFDNKLKALMGDKLKAYFEVKVQGTTLVVIKQVQDRDWYIYGNKIFRNQ